MLRADQATVLQVQAVLATAAVRGSDPARALDELGLLHHRLLRQDLMATALEQAADLLWATTVGQLAEGDRRAQTPLDLKRQVEGWLREQAAQIRKTS